MVEDQVEKLTIGDRISQGTLTATVYTVGPEFIGIRWEGKEWSAIYARTEMGRGFNDYGCARVSSGGQTLDAQVSALEAAGAEKVYSEAWFALR